MNREYHSQLPSTSQNEAQIDSTIVNSPSIEQEFRIHKDKSLFSLVKKNGSPPLHSKSENQNLVNQMICDECSEFLNMKLAEAEGNLVGRDKIIELLKNHLAQLKERNVKSIDDAQNFSYKYSVAKHELDTLKQICAKYEEELQKLRAEKASKQEIDQLALKFKEDAERWKKQYEDLLQKINVTEKSVDEGMKSQAQEDDWRNMIQNEVSTAVNILKENSQSLINSLEKQNRKLDTLVEKLQTELDECRHREHDTQKELYLVKSKLAEVCAQTEKHKCNVKSSNEKQIQLQQSNEKLKEELGNVTKLYAELQQDYKLNKDDIISSQQKLRNNILELNNTIHNLKESSLENIKKLQNELIEHENSSTVSEFINNISESIQNLETIIKNEDSLTEENAIEFYQDPIRVVKNLYDLQAKIVEQLYALKMAELGEENSNLQVDLQEKLKQIDEINLNFFEINAALKESIKENIKLNQQITEFNEEIENISYDLKSKEDVLDMQSSKICDLKEILEDEIEKGSKLSIENKALKSDLEQQKTRHVSLQRVQSDFENEILNMKSTLQQEKSLNKKMANDTIELRNKLETTNKEKQAIEEQNIDMKSSFLGIESEKNDLEEKLSSASTSNQGLRKVIDATKEKIGKLKTINQQLHDKLNEQNQTDDRKLEDFQRKIDSLSIENRSLTTQIEKEKQVSLSLKQHVDSLQFYHENEMKANEAQTADLKSEISSIQSHFFNELEKLKEQSQRKLGLAEDENKKLYDSINNLNKDVQCLNCKLKQVSNLSDPEKCDEILKNISEENIQLKRKMSSLQKQLDKFEFGVSTPKSCSNCPKRLKIKTDSNNVVYDRMQSTNDTKIIQLTDIYLNSESLNISNESDKALPIDAATQSPEQNEPLERIVEIDVESQKVVEKDINSDNIFELTLLNVDGTPSMQSKNSKDIISNNIVAKEIDSFNSNLTSDEVSEELLENEKSINSELLMEQISNIETQIGSLLEMAEPSEDIKSTSLPNLEVIKQDKEVNCNNADNLVGTSEAPLRRKTSSVENIVKNEDNKILHTSQNAVNEACTKHKYENRWEKQLLSIQRLRIELNGVLMKLDMRTTRDMECPSAECANKFKLVIDSLQRQVNELNVKSAEESQKCYGLQAELKGIKGQMVNKDAMEEEIKKLRKELYKQKVESVQEIEKCRIKKEAEILEMQFKMKQQFLEKKIKLLADLGDVQCALQKKTETQKKLRNKCEDLMKHVIVNQEMRNMKVQHVQSQPPMHSNIDLDLQSGLRDIFHPESRQHIEPETEQEMTSASYIRAKLNTTIEKHRLDAPDSVSRVSSSEEDKLKEKYLLQ